MKEKIYNSGIIPFLCGWIIFAGAYIFLKNQAAAYAGDLLSLIIILDIVATGYSFWLWRHAAKESKSIFALFGLSFACLIFDDSIYNIMYNILHLSHAQAPTALFTLDNIFYLGYLVFQFLAWLRILPLLAVNKPRKFFLYIPIAIILLAGLSIFILIIKSQHIFGQPLLMRFFNTTEVIFTIGGFIVAMLALMTSKHKSILFISIGFLIGTSSDLIMNFGIFTQKFAMGSVLETLWPLVIILMLYGLIVAKRTNNYKISPRQWTYEIDSIRSQVAFWTFALSILIVGILLQINHLVGDPRVFF